MRRPSAASHSSPPPRCSSMTAPTTSPRRRRVAGTASCTATTWRPARRCAPSGSPAERSAGAPDSCRHAAADRIERLHDLRLLGGRLHPRCGIFRLPLAGHYMKSEDAAEPLPATPPQGWAAREGREPRVIARLFSGWALFGERQFLRGYALLLPDPVVPTLTALGAQER